MPRNTSVSRHVQSDVKITESPAGPGENQAEIEALAHELWRQRECPIGTPEEDWFRAVERLKARKKDVSAWSAAGTV